MACKYYKIQDTRFTNCLLRLQVVKYPGQVFWGLLEVFVESGGQQRTH